MDQGRRQEHRLWPLAVVEREDERVVLGPDRGKTLEGADAGMADAGHHTAEQTTEPLVLEVGQAAPPDADLR